MDSGPCAFALDRNDEMSSYESLPYRSCAGLAVFNREGGDHGGERGKD